MREIIALAVICLLIVLASLGIAAWTAVSGSLFTLDGLLLVSICLMLAAVFGGCFLWLAYDAGWLERLKSRRVAGSSPQKKKD
ncbi:MAG: hypothetical protein ACRD4D_09315 [Candidatus Acidiferrales bacterium]